MYIRKAQPADLLSIMECIAHARQIMRANGNFTQWINGYPSPELMTEGMEKGEVYVCMEAGTIAGVFCFIIGSDPTYDYIENGRWLNEEPYAVIHRLATRGIVKGLATTVLDWCYKQHPNIRVDTHKDNTIMQHLFEKSGYQYCGIIYVNDGTPRLAYQKAA